MEILMKKNKKLLEERDKKPANSLKRQEVNNDLKDTNGEEFAAEDGDSNPKDLGEPPRRKPRIIKKEKNNLKNSNGTVAETPNVKVGEEDKNLPAEEYTFVGRCQSGKVEEFDSTSQPATGINVFSQQRQTDDPDGKQDKISKDYQGGEKEVSSAVMDGKITNKFHPKEDDSKRSSLKEDFEEAPSLAANKFSFPAIRNSLIILMGNIKNKML